VRSKVSDLWRKAVDKTWAAQSVRAQEFRSLPMNQNAELAETSAATSDELWEKARAEWTLNGPKAAEGLLRATLQASPVHTGACFVLGRHLIQQGDREGEALLRRTIDADDEAYTIPAWELLVEHYQSQGFGDQVRLARQAMSQFIAEAEPARRERAQVSASDRFGAHELSEEELARLQSVLSSDGGIVAAYLCRKELKHRSRQRLFVLCVHSRTGWFGRSNPDADRALATRLIPKVHLPGRVLVITPQGGFRRLASKIRRRPDARVFAAEDVT
jgi:hypothetical protein